MEREKHELWKVPQVRARLLGANLGTGSQRSRTLGLHFQAND